MVLDVLGMLNIKSIGVNIVTAESFLRCCLVKCFLIGFNSSSTLGDLLHCMFMDSASPLHLRTKSLGFGLHVVMITK